MAQTVNVAAPAASERYAGITLLERLRQIGILVALLVIGLVFSFLTPTFLTMSNLQNIAVQSSITAILGIGMTLIIISGGIDLSIGPIVALVTVVVATILLQGTPIWLAIAIGLGIGVLCGLFNGSIIAYLGMQPFIVTLGSMSLYRGMALVYTNGDPIFKVPSGFRAVFGGTYGVMPAPIVFMLLMALIAFVLLNFTRIGVYIKSIGGNEEAARMSGVHVNFYKMFTYTLNGVFAALAGLVLLGRLGAAEPIAGSGYELDAIAAAAVGGTSMLGGRGNIPGTILGALILGALRNGLTLMNVQAFYQLLATGLIILVAVGVDRFTRGKR